MHEMSQGSWISLLPFICATPHHCSLAQQHEFVETLALAESLAPAETCISYVPSGMTYRFVTIYKSNPVILRDLVVAAVSQ